MSHHDVATSRLDRLPDDPSVQPIESALRSTQADSPAESFDWREWFRGFVQRVFVMLAIYVLSIGPLYWQWYGARFAGESPWLAAFYEPLVIVAQLIPPFGRWMDWYVGLWIG